MTERKQEKKKFNWPLFLFSACITLGMVGVFSYGMLNHQADFTVEKYKVDKETFNQNVQNMLDQYTVRREGDKPVVHPPPDSDVYIPARNFDWGGFIVELERDQPYRLHLLSYDIKHGLIIRDLMILKKVRPDKAVILHYTPKLAGEFEMICGEYCGPGHGAMVGKLIIVDTPTKEPGAK